ncbi:hypothetical protein IID21_05205 [Patescibacteria group bacterium]|nr:hypothetical protein [Patescibacteria group bacterium]
MSRKQELKLSKKGISFKVIEQRRQTRLKNEELKRRIIVDNARSEIDNLTQKEIKLIGPILYWAEGGKKDRSLVRFANSDPEMIKFMMNYFRKVCKVPEHKFRGYIHIHPHLDHKKAENYWSKITRIPLKRFYKTYRKTNIASKHSRDNLPLGTLEIYICSTELFLKISGWVQGIFKAY